MGALSRASKFAGSFLLGETSAVPYPLLISASILKTLEYSVIYYSYLWGKKKNKRLERALILQLGTASLF